MIKIEEKERLLKNIKPLANCQKILITGPQRSGTRIATKIVADVLKFKNIEEQYIKFNSTNKLFLYLFSKESLVIQCPQISSICHMIDTPKTGLIFMIRNIKDIELSEQRIKWEKSQEELDKYFISKGTPSEIKYIIWEKYQKPNMQIPFCEINYESLSFHKFWIEQSGRRGFKWDQTTYGN